MSGLCGPDLTHVGRTLGHSPASQVVHIPGLGQLQGCGGTCPCSGQPACAPECLLCCRWLGGSGPPGLDRALFLPRCGCRGMCTQWGGPQAVWVLRSSTGGLAQHAQPFWKHISEALTFSLQACTLETQSLNTTERSPQVVARCFKSVSLLSDVPRRRWPSVASWFTSALQKDLKCPCCELEVWKCVSTA